MLYPGPSCARLGARVFQTWNAVGLFSMFFLVLGRNSFFGFPAPESAHPFVSNRALSVHFHSPRRSERLPSAFTVKLRLSRAFWRSLLRSAFLIRLGNVYVAMAPGAKGFARAGSGRLMESVSPRLGPAYFRSWRVLLETSPMGRREAMKCLRPAVSWGQAPRGKTDTAGASGPPVLSARWCAVVHNEEDRGRDKRNIKDGMFGYSTQTW
jgi:hypothetical protein